MQIFMSEIQDGLEEKIAASTTIAYAEEAYPCEEKFKSMAYEFVNAKKKTKGEKDGKVKLDEDPDLYYLQSVMVTSNWNKNDDVFTRGEIVRAKDTPVNKPTNLNHNETAIVGHITGSWMVDDKYELLDVTTAIDDLPNIFHIITASVVYKTFDNEDYKKSVAELIEKIESGEKYVSMECRFQGFDYAVMGAGGDYKIVARNENTSWLTKHLRAYGGKGIYKATGNDYKIGRLLKNVRFIAHGFVDKPANVNSIIFKSGEHFDFAKAQNVDVFEQNGVLSNEVLKPTNEVNKVEKIMANELDTVNDLKAELKEIKSELTKANEKVSKANIDAYETKIKDLNDAVKANEATIKELQAEAKKANDAETETKKKFEQASSEVAEAKKELYMLKTMQAKKAKADKLVSIGYDLKVAEAKVEAFAELTDAQFEALFNELAEAKKMSKKDEKADKKEDDAEGAKKDKKDMKDDSKDCPTASAKADEEKDEKEGKAENALNDISKKNEPAMTTQADESKTPDLRKAIAGLLQAKKSSKINRRK